MEMKDFKPEIFDLSGKVAIVTGGATGMGQAFAYALAACGANIVITSHRNEAKETVGLVESVGKKILVVKGNLVNEEDRKALIEQTVEEFGRIDILVNNAGTIERAPALEYTREQWENVIDINLNAVFFLTQEVANIMVNQGHGKIINISSMLAYQGGKFVPAYTASKHAVNGITKSFANELASQNVQVNAVAPGYVMTNNTEPILKDKARKESISSRIPAGRWAKPADIAGAVVFLAGGASDYINGITIPVDGGWLSN